MIFLTQNSTFIIGQVAWLLGKIMEGIFTVIDFIGLPNIGLAIILFTIVVNLLLLPLTIKQQKFSKLSAKLQPEVQAIQNKYKGKKDNDSMLAQNQEIQEVYAKYGVSPSGSCVQLLIQMPILFALYRVIQSMPAYVGKIKETFGVLADAIIGVDGGNFLQNSGIDSIANTVNMYGRAMTADNLRNGVIDVLHKLSTADMTTVAQHYNLTNLTYQGELILSSDTTRGLIDTYNNFLGMNMGNSPAYIVSEALKVGAWGLVIGAIAIPVLSAVTQWINVKLMPTQNNDSKDSPENSMMQSMKMMNMIMPLMSAWFCYSLPCGMGLYWVAGSVFRSIQQVVINKHIDKMDFDELIKKNSVKSAKKLEKLKAQQERLNAYSNMNTRNIQSKANVNQGTSSSTGTSSVASKANTASKSSTAAKGKNASGQGSGTSGSIMAKANMVKQYNERNGSNKNNK